MSNGLSLTGLHHITALASDPQRNVDFYTGVLGLRLVKRTVNFDAPTVYHLYYGDANGTPGTILTFFPYPNAAQGKRGSGEVHSIGFRISSRSIDYWIHRVSSYGLFFDGPSERFGETVMTLLDPDGLKVDLIASDDRGRTAEWTASSVPPEHSLGSFHSITMAYLDDTWTGRFLTDAMGLRKFDTRGRRTRYEAGIGPSQAIVDTVVLADITPPRQSAGSVHHVAWRASGDAEQKQWREWLMQHGSMPTEIVDRKYFQSIYFREPGGVLFEIATDGPGFAIDEEPDRLGSTLKLPPWYEDRRAQLERTLIPLTVRV